MDTQDFEGLKALLESAFPKKCGNCGHIYETAQQFFMETQDMPFGRPSLKAAVEDDGCNVVEAFRNCRCGSTLMDEFGCRRDQSDKGSQRREAFERMSAILQARNISVAEARTEIVNFLHGQPNNLEALLNVEIIAKI